jgi:hypothetical protein
MKIDFDNRNLVNKMLIVSNRSLPASSNRPIFRPFDFKNYTIGV